MEKNIDRISQLIEHKELSVRAFELSIGASNGAFGRAIRNRTDISSEWLSIIVEKYPDINPNWLLTGRGEMIRNEESQATNVETTIVYKSDPKDLEIIKDKTRIIALQEDKIRMLEEKVAILPAVLDSARSVDTMLDAGTQPLHK